MRWLWVCSVMLASAAFAEPPDVPDPSMIPDASVGQGGAQMGNEESDNQANCMSDRDCDRGLKCEKFRCTWQQYRQATFSGCGGGKALAVLSLGFGAVAFRSRRRRQGRVKS